MSGNTKHQNHRSLNVLKASTVTCGGHRRLKARLFRLHPSCLRVPLTRATDSVVQRTALSVDWVFPGIPVTSGVSTHCSSSVLLSSLQQGGSTSAASAAARTSRPPVRCSVRLRTLWLACGSGAPDQRRGGRACVAPSAQPRL